MALRGYPRRALAVTIWAPAALQDVQHNMRPLIRIALPVLDVALIAFGCVALIVGSPTVAAVTLSPVAEWWSVILIASSVGAMVGLVFQLAWCEMYAKILLGAALLVYALWAGLSPARTGTLSPFLAACLAVSVCAVLGWRIYFLTGKLGQKAATS